MTTIPPRPPVGQRDLTLKKKKPRTGLRQSHKPRPLTPAQMQDLVQQVQLRDGRCVMIDHHPAICDGKTDAHHIVGQRILSAHFERGHPIFMDLRNAVALCNRHHNLIERRLAYLPDEVLPDGFGQFLGTYGFRVDFDAAIARRV